MFPFKLAECFVRTSGPDNLPSNCETNWVLIASEEREFGSTHFICSLRLLTLCQCSPSPSQGTRRRGLGRSYPAQLCLHRMQLSSNEDVSQAVETYTMAVHTCMSWTEVGLSEGLRPPESKFEVTSLDGQLLAMEFVRGKSRDFILRLGVNWSQNWSQRFSVGHRPTFAQGGQPLDSHHHEHSRSPFAQHNIPILQVQVAPL